MQEKNAIEWSDILWSIVVLVAVLAFLYMIFFGIEKPQVSLGASEQQIVEPQWERDKQDLWTQWEGTDTIIWTSLDEPSSLESQSTPIAQVQIAWLKLADDWTVWWTDWALPWSWSEWSTNWSSSTWWVLVAHGKTFFSVQELFQEANEKSDGMIPLSWTFVWEWALRSLVDFGLIWQEQYVLKTIENTHFAYLWSFSSRHIPLLESLWWNIVEITDKNYIHENGLFWDKIWFLNTQRYKDLEKVIYLVFFHQTNDVRFVQMDRDHYYASKETTQKIFDMWYDW